MGAAYIQHNADVGHGTDGFIAYFERMQQEYPEKSMESVRYISEGNLVALHTQQTWPGNDEYVTMDFFRFYENGKICEYRDAIQQIPIQYIDDLDGLKTPAQFSNRSTVYFFERIR